MFKVLFQLQWYVERGPWENRCAESLCSLITSLHPNASNIHFLVCKSDSSGWTNQIISNCGWTNQTNTHTKLQMWLFTQWQMSSHLETQPRRAVLWPLSNPLVCINTRLHTNPSLCLLQTSAAPALSENKEYFLGMAHHGEGHMSQSVPRTE